ncbi:MAG: tetratricopeptide repeat protein [Gammaproteobacteria bacterium]|nr:tetratricopeptide repeat protein [Gammaproteobacteria bacterium]
MIKKNLFSGVLLANILLTACSQHHFPVTGDNNDRSGTETEFSQRVPGPGFAKPENGSGELLYYLMVAEIAGMRGQISVTAQAYQKAIELSSDYRIAQRAVQVAIFARENSMAINAAKKWVELQPDSREAQQSLALLYARTGKPEHALEQFIKLVELAMAKDTDAGNQELLRIGMLLQQILQSSVQNNQAPILKVMSRLVKHFSGNPTALVAYSRLLFHAKDFQLAGDAVKEALKLDPELDSANVLQANVFMAQGQSEKALPIMEKMILSHPKEKNYSIVYARMLAEAGKYDQARIQFDTLLSKTPKDSEILYALALLSMETRNYDKAEEYLHRLLETDKKHAEAYLYLGNIADSRGRYDKAIEWFSQVKDGSREIEAHLRIAILLGKKGDVDAALAYLKKFQSKDALLAVRLITVKVDILNSAKRYLEAMEVANKGLEQYPENLTLYYVRSLLADRLNRLELAEQDLRKVLAKEPDNPNALNALGYMLADRTDRYQEALGYVRRAIDQAPNQPAYIDSMGWVHYRLGNYDEALRYLKKAFELDQDSEIAAHLGEVLWQAGDHAEAREIWQRAQKKDPDNETLNDVIKRFTQSSE